MRIGILGGSFSPPHRGHFSIGNQAIENDLVDEVWIMPCPERPGKVLSASAHHRLNMCHLYYDPEVNDKYKKFKVSDFQIRKNFKTTIETHEAIVREDKVKSTFEGRDQHHFYWIIGQDCADEIESWKDYKRLIEEVNFIVFKRDGNKGYSDLKEKWYFKSPHVYAWHEKFESFNSSTHIREYVAKGKIVYLSLYLPNRLIRYIEENKLYLSKTLDEIIGDFK